MRDGMQARPASLLSVADPWFKFQLNPVDQFNWVQLVPVGFARIPH